MKQTIVRQIYKILKNYAQVVIKKHDPFVVGVTGSVGKTSTKEAIYAVMKKAFPNEVRANAGNLNAEIGLPLTILGYTELPKKLHWPIFLLKARSKTKIEKYPKYLILEMGVEHEGDIDYFSTIVKPNIGVITATTPAHVANFSSVEKMQEEKIKMAKILKDGGKLVYNMDDEILSKNDFGEASSYSIINPKADFFASDIRVSLRGNKYTLNYRGEKIEINTKFLGRQLIYSDLAATAVGKIINVNNSEIKSALESRESIPGRMNVLDGRNDITIIDDTYNSNPASACAAIDTLSEIEHLGRKVLILGNMNELGVLEQESHKKVGQWAKGKCDFAIFIGKNAETMSKAYNDAKNSRIFENRNDFIAESDRLLLKGDLVLIKASQNKNYFEEIVKVLMKHPSQSDKVLVRQGSEWQSKKNS